MLLVSLPAHLVLEASCQASNCVALAAGRCVPNQHTLLEGPQDMCSPSCCAGGKNDIPGVQHPEVGIGEAGGSHLWQVSALHCQVAHPATSC